MCTSTAPKTACSTLSGHKRIKSRTQLQELVDIQTREVAGFSARADLQLLGLQIKLLKQRLRNAYVQSDVLTNLQRAVLDVATQAVDAAPTVCHKHMIVAQHHDNTAQAAGQGSGGTNHLLHHKLACIGENGLGMCRKNGLKFALQTLEA